MNQPTTTNPSDWEQQSEDTESGPAATLAIPVVVLIAVAALVVGLAGGFLVERSRIKKHHTVAAVASAPLASSTPKGTVTAVSGDTVTIQTGKKSLTLTLDAATVVLKGTPAHSSDIASGQKVEVTGQPQADGSVLVKRFTIVGS